MENQFERSALLLGGDSIKKLSGCLVAVFGLGGVGGYAAEALVRSGVGAVDFIDGDALSLTNLNRQILALHSTLGRNKAEVAAERARDINPHIKATARPLFFDAVTQNDFDFSDYDYVIDAIDCVTSKLLLAKCCKRSGTPIISCMGAGNKLDPTAFKVADIYSTSVCPLARVMRRELKKLGVEKLKVVYSEEPPVKAEVEDTERASGGRGAPASVAFVPSVAGLIVASEVIKDLLKI